MIVKLRISLVVETLDGLFLFTLFVLKISFQIRVGFDINKPGLIPRSVLLPTDRSNVAPEYFSRLVGVSSFSLI